MKIIKITIILILISLTDLFSVWGIESDFIINNTKGNRLQFTAFSSLIEPSKHKFGAGLMCDTTGDLALTGEYYFVYAPGDGWGCKYYTFESGISSNSELHFAFSHTTNIFLYNLKLNFIQIRVKDGNKPIVGFGIGLGFGLHNSIVKP